jgi:hypothetical protein
LTGFVDNDSAIRNYTGRAQTLASSFDFHFHCRFIGSTQSGLRCLVLLILARVYGEDTFDVTSFRFACHLDDFIVSVGDVDSVGGQGLKNDGR